MADFVWDAAYYRHTANGSVTLYYGGAAHHLSVAVTGVVRDTTIALPFQTGHGGTITGGQLDVFSPASNAIMRIGLYASTDSFDNYPGAFIADLGSVACASTFSTFSCATVSTSAHALWWLCYNINSNTTMQFHSGETGLVVWGEPRTAFGQVNHALTYDQPMTSCWLATFPASATTVGGVARLLRLSLRYGSIP